MRFQRTFLASVTLILSMTLLFPMVAFAHLISITATSSFPSAVRILSTTTAIFTVKNITSKITLTVVDQSRFPDGSGLSISSSTCGNPIGPGQSCDITVQLQAPGTPQTISSELREWAKPSADGVRHPFSVNVIGPAQYTITPSAGSNGAIIPSTPQVVDSGGSVTFTATPATSYTVNQWRLDGAVVQTGGTTYTLNNITSNHTVNVSFMVGIPVVVGFSDLNHANNLPVAYTSNDGGSNWILSSAFTLPSGQPQGELLSVICESNICIAGGKSFDNSSNNNLPMVYTSSDGGSNWTLSSALTLPSGKVQGDINGITCIDSLTCAVVGQAFDSSGSNNLPLVYTSSNGGINWTLSPTFSLPSGQNEGFLFGVTCVGSACVTVGASDNSGSNTLPLAYTSSDGGSHWTLSSAFSIPSGHTEGELFSTVCVNSTTCTAVGESFDSGFTNQLPLAYTSSDGGSHWTLSSIFPLPSGQTDGLLNSVTCIGSACTAVGESFQSGFSNVLPLAYTSSDGGRNWTLSSAFTFPSGQNQGLLTSVSCLGLACIAVGETYQTGFNNDLPVAYTSSDGGSNWTLSSAFSLPSGQNQGELLGATG
jgi:hypothetical protein